MGWRGRTRSGGEAIQEAEYNDRGYVRHAKHGEQQDTAGIEYRNEQVVRPDVVCDEVGDDTSAHSARIQY